MIDSTTNKPLRVGPTETVRPYIAVAADQLEEVKRLLDSHGVRYWVEEELISMNDGPYIATIKLRRRTDANAIQAILDSVP
jgi:hypothetical protein